MSELPICTRLVREMVQWLDNLVKQDQAPTKTFTGVRSDGQQFICLMSAFPLDGGDMLALMSEALKLEGCVAFAHSMRMGKLAEGEEEVEEVVDIFAGQTGLYHFCELEYTNEGLKLVQDITSPEPQIFFHELPPEHYKPSPKKEELLLLWQRERPNFLWRSFGILSDGTA